MSSTLTAHVDSSITPYEEILSLPDPKPLTPGHRPVRHDLVIDTLKDRLTSAGLHTVREQFAVGGAGEDKPKLFGVLDLKPRNGVWEWFGDVMPESGISVGFRHANDQSLALSIVAGARVFVCDNLALAGRPVLMKRRHTSGLSLQDEIDLSIGSLQNYLECYGQDISQLKSQPLTDTDARLMIYDAVRRGIVQPKLLAPVDQAFFHPVASDTEPRNSWGLYNAFTRALQGRGTGTFRSHLGYTERVGAYFGIGSSWSAKNE